MAGQDVLKERVIESAAAAQHAIRELVNSTSTGHLSVDQVRAVETRLRRAHQAIGDAANAAGVLAKERQRGE